MANASKGVGRSRPTNLQIGPSAIILNQILKPALRAYALGHISTTGPKLAGLLLALVAGKKNVQRHFDKLKHIATSSLGFFRYPSFCASLVGLYSALQIVFVDLLARWSSGGSRPVTASAARSRVRVARFLAALVASWVTFPMLNRGDARVTRRRALSDIPVDPTMTHLEADPAFASKRGLAVSPSYAPGGKPPPVLAGRTMDLTIMASVRAVETLIWHAWRRRFAFSKSRLAQFVADASDSGMFISACFMIMWSWFYSPLSLPPSYRRWIGQAAGVDPRLVEVLRKARWGSFVYGVETGQGYIMEGMCREHGWPLEWAEPAKTIPVPCEIVHQGTGASCHWHKVVKFTRVFSFAMRMYLPLQLVLRLRGGLKNVTLQSLRKGVLEAARSSAFLGAFVSLFYYGVCLSRTVVGPKLFSLDTVSRQDWDSGYCVGAGSALCGWSVLIEPARRRQELALFVAPRAASCFVPNRYERKYLNRERAAFASGLAVLFALAHESPTNVRGIVGSLMHTVIA